MKKRLPTRLLAAGFDGARRRLMRTFVTGTGLAALGVSGMSRANTVDNSLEELRFPGDPARHKVVYQFNKADREYHQHVLFSVGAMVREYGDNIKIVVTCFGPGIHILAKHPLRPVTEQTRERVSSLAHYGVEFHACNNTLKSLDWTAKDLVPFAKVVEAGADDLMRLQEKGYAYLSW